MQFKGQLFADSGDSGSLIVTFQKNEVDEMEIEKCLAVGMVYAVLLEDPPMPSLAFFYPIRDLMHKLRRETGLDLCVPDEREFYYICLAVCHVYFFYISCHKLRQIIHT
jgi:hypothetical protein